MKRKNKERVKMLTGRGGNVRDKRQLGKKDRGIQAEQWV